MRIKMNNALPPLLASVAGLIFGAYFYGGLWFTVRKGVASPRPVLWFIGSLILRLTIVFGGFIIVGGVDYQRWLGCLVGFIIARFGVLWLTQPFTSFNPPMASEVRDAP